MILNFSYSHELYVRSTLSDIDFEPVIASVANVSGVSFVRLSLFDRAEIGARAKETEEGREGRGKTTNSLFSSLLPLSSSYKMEAWWCSTLRASPARQTFDRI